LSTTLARQIRSIFRSYAEQYEKQKAGETISILTCWKRTLGNTPAAPGQIFESLALVSAALGRLIAQVDSSEKLDDEAKSVAHAVINGFVVFVNPELFPRSVQDYHTRISSQQLGTLGMLSNSLEQEYPEPDLPPNELNELIGDVQKLGASIRESSLNENLKSLLVRHVDFLLWALNNLTFGGFQAVYEGLACTVIVTRNIPDIEPRGSHSETKGLKGSILKLCTKIGRALKHAENVNSGLEAVNHLGQDAIDFVDSAIDNLG
jgi:hypothetical protein